MAEVLSTLGVLKNFTFEDFEAFRGDDGPSLPTVTLDTVNPTSASWTAQPSFAVTGTGIDKAGKWMMTSPKGNHDMTATNVTPTSATVKAAVALDTDDRGGCEVMALDATGAHGLASINVTITA